MSLDTPAELAAELWKIDKILSKYGFEYPQGAHGVEDMAIRYAVMADELHRLDPDHWAPMTFKPDDPPRPPGMYRANRSKDGL